MQLGIIIFNNGQLPHNVGQFLQPIMGARILVAKNVVKERLNRKVHYTSPSGK